MLGLLYIVLCIGIGWALCAYFFPGLKTQTRTDYYGNAISMSGYLILFPAWYITGTLALTWPVYLIAYLFGSVREPLLYANLIVMPIAFSVFAFLLYLRVVKNKREKSELICKDRKTVRIEYVLVGVVLLLASILMWTTFFVRADKLYVGVSVFSDFSPHLGMIRSFSYGNNFPTTYSHYAGQDIRYHFMFQFLTGNLEYLGMRLDYAFNIPSILSLVSAFLLLYVLAVKITGKVGAGILTCMFFAFRSSKTLFTYLANLPAGTSILGALTKNMDFISDTTHEEWGLWNLNVYCNQRHLAFGLSVMFLVLILFMQHLFDMFAALKTVGDDAKEGRPKKLTKGLMTFFGTKEAWIVSDIRQSIGAGILLGSIAFFHGSAQICCLMILFFMAIFSRRRFEYAITAAITLGLAVLQTHFFIHGSALSPEPLFGFLADNKTLFGTASYLERLLGILPFVLLAAFCLEKAVGRYLILIFITPLLFAFTVSLTIDVTVNHKYIMMSCILLGIFAAAFIIKMFERKDYLVTCVGIFLIVALTATGIYDFVTVLKKNTPQSAIVLNLDDPLTTWVHENSDSKDIFLTPSYALNQVVLGGAMLFEGWPYFPWSAGYDTNYRSEQVKLMYEAGTPAELEALVKKNDIRFIIVDSDARTSDSYFVNEDNIMTTYLCVYSFGETSIYDTQKSVKR
jgi:hypothetical protein